MMRKTPVFFLLILFFAVLLVLPAEAASFRVMKGIGTDDSVFAPGVFDLIAVTDAEEPQFQWVVRVGNGDGASNYMELENDEKWQGVNTAHLSLITNDGLKYSEDGSGWDGLFFCCRVTDKDGTVRYGPDVNMIIFTHQSLLDRFERDGVRYSDFGVTYEGGARLEFAEEINGVKYYNSYGDKGLIPWSRSGTVDEKISRQSEVEVKTEISVTYDGQTAPYSAPLHGFVPKRYGKSVVTFRYDLVLYVNGNRMETLDSETAVVNVLQPECMGVALTGSSCAVLEEQYSQAKVLAQLEKNTRVPLLSESGGYYKVAVNGVFGYLPKTALNVVPNVTSVALEIPEPSDYAFFDLNPTLFETDLYKLYKTEPVTWYDRTADRFLTGNDTFLPGHSYRLGVWLAAKDGKRFSVKGREPDVAAEINGRAAAVNVAYEQDPEEVIEITYDFDHVHDLKKVTQKNPTCTEPGKKTYYHCDCGADFEDHLGKVRIMDANWGVIPAQGHWASEWRSDGTSHYKVCQRRECGAVIPGTTGAHAGGRATCTQGAVCEVCGLAYGETASHRWSSEWNYADETGHAHYCADLCGSRSPIEKHVPGPAATETEPQVCLVCGYVLQAPVNHLHELKKTAGKTAGCETAGIREHYVCAGCGALFADESGNQPISEADTVISPLGHEASSGWVSDDEAHWHTCVRCGMILTETKGSHVFDDDSAACVVCGFGKPKIEETTAGTAAPVTPETVKETEAPGSETEKQTEPAATKPSETEGAKDPAVTRDEKPPEGGSFPLVPVLIAAGIVLVIAVVIVAFAVSRKRKKKV